MCVSARICPRVSSCPIFLLERNREKNGATIQRNMKELTKQQQIERSIITTYRKGLWSPFALAVKKYRLIQSGDRIAVCISGGKDSMLLAKLMQEMKELGCNKIALGHHKSDVIETTLMAMLYGGQIQGMLPRLKSKNFEGLELIRPMYCIAEEDVLRWRDGNGLDFIACACKFTENTASETTFSARKRVKELIAELKKEIPSVEDNIFQSIHNVQLDTLVRYKTEGAEVSFLRNFTE